jgi:signal transduction histidine kinase
MKTYFAPAERATRKEMQQDIALTSQSPVIDALLQTASGLLAVLNEHRQVLAVNDAFLRMLGVDNPSRVLGLRPGEAIRCVHADELEGGCGTSEFCSTCGAAIAIVATLASGTPEDRKCVVTIERDGDKVELCLKVRSHLFAIGDRRFILLFLQDISIPERWAALERVFFHDISNLLTGLQGASTLLQPAGGPQNEELVAMIRQLSSRLAGEVAVQRALCKSDLAHVRLAKKPTRVQQIIEEIGGLFTNHPAAKGKTLRLPDKAGNKAVTTDPALLLRVLGNLLTNAFEATEEGGDVRLWVEEEPTAITFYVWNRQAIPANAAKRVFQRYFSTKPEPGRGLGTYATKLIGEQFLGGKVSFMSSESEGTTFRFRLPTVP